MIIATDVMPSHWDFYFQDSGMPLLVSGSWSCFMCRAHTTLQELQAVAVINGFLVIWLGGCRAFR